MRILVVEDNPKLASSIKKALTEYDYSVDVAHTGYDAEELASADVYDLYILDLMLPDRDGIDLCRNLRKMDIAAPVLLLTALSGTQKKVEGLDAGADDYLTKPFELDELLARVRALLRRGTATEAVRLTYADVEMDLAKRVVSRAGEKLSLTAKEFALLEFFMRHPDKVLSRSVITEKVWDMNYEPSSNVVDVYISNLRKKVDRSFTPVLIHTVVGTGYRFGADNL
jgi:two-component system copper resistance phosphate regulon response regulator CusR